MKKSYPLLLALLALSLTGCSQKNTKKAVSPAKVNVSETYESSQTIHQGTEAQNSEASDSQENKSAEIKQTTETNDWNTTKEKELAVFMSSWGAEMGQTYQAYSPSNNSDFYGIKFPNDLLNGSRNVKVSGQVVKLHWSKDGNGSDYQVVAAYSDSATANYGGKHFYLFALVSGQPQTLVTMQNQGNEDNSIEFKETENQDLRNGFAQIVGGDTSQPQTSKQTTTNNEPITTEAEADRLIRKGNIPDYHDQPPYVVSSKAQTDGSYVLTITSGAKGQDIFTLTPNDDGTVHIHVQYGSGEGGKFTLFPDQSSHGPTDVTVER
ncbi:DUF4767 domain-containing protein [Enterococcus sp. CSURQ0835]|uniref:DUF4767 domain-containing protein n=1 Tax=Enterococcus sp. CSURQ0835 TaxID=2681394 RepID=UPI00135CD256|nr:DUF4767 domain-containing protein [Enterococcus sp. CSURQ0835]